MGYEILPHTAEIGIRATAATLEEVYVEALRALAAIMLDAEPPFSGGAMLPVRFDEDDAASVLASLLEESLFLAEARAQLPVGGRLRVSQHEDGFTLEGELDCVPDPPVVAGVKAVTYHGLDVSRDREVWRATAYFDV